MILKSCATYISEVQVINKNEMNENLKQQKYKWRSVPLVKTVWVTNETIIKKKVRRLQNYGYNLGK